MGVYVVTSGEFAKIGVSANVKARIASLQTGSPITLTLHHLEPVSGKSAYLVERRAHQIVGADRAKGEWFKVSPADARRAVLDAAKELSDGVLKAAPRRHGRFESVTEELAAYENGDLHARSPAEIRAASLCVTE